MGLIRWLNSEGVKGTVKKTARPVYRLFRNKHFNIFLKLVLVAILIYTIRSQVFAKDNIDGLWAEFLNRFTRDNAWWIIVTILLMPLNWAIETLKWQVLVRKVEEVPFFKAFKGVFLGVSLSVFTPNRIGEYGGRILVVKPENNWKTIVATLVSSFSQQIALMTLGIVGLIYFMLEYFMEDTEGFIVLGVGMLGLTLIVFMFLCYYNVNLAIPLFNKLPYLRRFTKHMEVLDEYSFKELTAALFYAILRYVIYTMQYYLILRFFGIDVPFLSGIAGIATIFLLQTSIPLPAIADLFVRSEVALYIWNFFTDNEISILASTFGLWFLNIIIPAILGMLFIFSVNITGSLGMKKNDDVT
jgi:hypothetical protein